MFHRKRDDDAPSRRCGVHNSAHGAAHCRSHRDPYCNEFLVYPFGTKRPPCFIACAIVAAGIRQGPR